MFFYILHNLPLFQDLDNAKRNVRTFIIGTVLYIILHAYLFSSYGNSNENIKLFRDYIYYLITADVIAVGVLYKLYYGKSILSEVSSLVGIKDDKKILYRKKSVNKNAKHPSSVSGRLKPTPNIKQSTKAPVIQNSVVTETNEPIIEDNIQIPTYKSSPKPSPLEKGESGGVDAEVGVDAKSIEIPIYISEKYLNKIPQLSSG